MKTKQTITKIIGVSILFLLLISTTTALPQPNTIQQETPSSTPQTLDDYTHTVIVEACTASWCPPCATAADVMHNIFYSGNYDFYYVALVYDKNSYATPRLNELGVSSIPDYVFDGGYTRHVGSGGIPAEYTNRLNQCGARNVKDIDLNLDIAWLGNNKIDINLDITNHETTTYNGHLHVYVTEIESRWNTYSGKPYHFAMIGNYAFNIDTTINADDTTTHETTWDGASYGLTDLQEDNIMVIAMLFDKNNNYYSDEATAASFVELWPADLQLNLTTNFGSVIGTLKNIGSTYLTNIDWSLSVQGGILGLINTYTNGTIDALPAQAEFEFENEKTIFGLGPATITVTAAVGTRTTPAFVLGPFIFLR